MYFILIVGSIQVDDSGTIAKERLFDDSPSSENDKFTNGNETDPTTSESVIADTGPINENLFLDDDDLDEELENLDLDK